jgi:dihydropteroate synthase
MKLGKYNFKLTSPTVMGICNVTPDSFSDGGKSFKSSDALKNIKEMVKNGASIIDIGAESTRPGSDPLTHKEEVKRLEPILKKLPKNKFVISVDTNKIETQEYALNMGAHIINDVFGGSEDLFFLSKKFKTGLILMHTPAPPKTMQKKIHSYNNVVQDIKKIFLQKIKQLEKIKIPSSKVWFDPGIGFGKNLKQNIEIMQKINQFKFKGYGLLLGSSRKSWINFIDKSETIKDWEVQSLLHYIVIKRELIYLEFTT